MSGQFKDFNEFCFMLLTLYALVHVSTKLVLKYLDYLPEKAVKFRLLFFTKSFVSQLLTKKVKCDCDHDNSHRTHLY